MELEQMRFSHKFEFSFQIDKTINTRDTFIPSMLFQPYLENSIWHGVLPMKQQGQIDITINKIDKDSISIKIVDNGIGIETSRKSKEDKPEDHISAGMEITKNRLALYQQINKINATVNGPFEINKDGISVGTQVELVLPLLGES